MREIKYGYGDMETFGGCDPRNEDTDMDLTEDEIEILKEEQEENKMEQSLERMGYYEKEL